MKFINTSGKSALNVMPAGMKNESTPLLTVHTQPRTYSSGKLQAWKENQQKRKELMEI